MKFKPLTKKFFSRSAITVAKELLGKYLVRKIGNKIISLKITETEAYHGFKDQASHAFRGKTKRNEVMFGEAGVWYVYFTYGMHFMLNIVTSETGQPSAVLIRGTETVIGPGRLTKFLSIDKKLNGNVASIKNGLWVEDSGEKVLKKEIQRTPRIGIGYAGDWVEKPYRFVLKN